MKASIKRILERAADVIEKAYEWQEVSAELEAIESLRDYLTDRGMLHHEISIDKALPHE